MDYKEKLKAIINSNKTPFVDIDTFLKYFPELKESENERIRKALIELVRMVDKNPIHQIFGYGDIKYSDMIAWLEKQGEQESITCSDGTIDNSWEGIINAAIYWGKEAPTENGRIPEDKVKGAVDYYCSLIRNNDGWSEEDKKMIIKICQKLYDYPRIKSPFDDESFNEAQKEVQFIKSLKDRVQPMQEWSEEDERILKVLISHIEKHGGGIDGYECSFLNDFLKSLKDRVQPQNLTVTNKNV